MIRTPPRLAKTVFACFLSLISALLLSVGPARAQDGVLRIAAVVNDDIITVRDLEARVHMIVTTSQMPDSVDTRSRLRPQILRSLIQETLRLQEADRLEISVTDDEIQGGFAKLEAQNKMPPGVLAKFLQSKGVDPETMRDQIRAELAWFRVVGRTIEPMVSVGEQEVDAQLDIMRANMGRSQYLAAEIFLPFESAVPESEVQALGQKLVQQIRGGAAFPALARQFSQSPTAALGGDLGWVFQGQLTQELDEALAQMTPGQVEGPIRTLTGFYIVVLRDSRAGANIRPEDIKLTLSQLLLPVEGPKAVDAETRAAIIAKAERVVSCSALDALAAEYELAGSGSVGVLSAADLPQNVRSILVDQPENKATQPVPVSGAEAVFMVCNREIPNILPPRDRLKDALMGQRVDMLARRKLRDLQRAAIIDIRM